MSDNKRISSVEFLWGLIPKDAQNMIAMQYDGLNRAIKMHACEVTDAVDGFPLPLRDLSGQAYYEEPFEIGVEVKNSVNARKVREYYSPTVQCLLDEADAEDKKEMVEFVVDCLTLLPCPLIDFRKHVGELYDKKFKICNAR